MQEALEAAVNEAARGNWLAVSHWLQQLPLSGDGSTIFLKENAEWETVIKLALQVLQEGDFQQRWDITKLLSKMGERPLPFLIEILENPNANLDSRWFAGRVLSQIQHPDSVFALAKLLQETEDEDLVLMATQALANLDILAVEYLQGLLKVPESRGLGVMALSQIRRVEIIAPLLEIAADSDPAIRIAVIEALASFSDERVLPILLAGLEDPEPDVRQEAIIALGRRSPQPFAGNITAYLQPLLYDVDLNVCQQAALALGRLGTEAAVTPLCRVLNSSLTPLSLQESIILALSWIPRVEALNCLQTGLVKSNFNLCREIVVALGKQELPHLQLRATEILSDFLASGEPIADQPQVKMLLAASLGDLGQAEATESLEQLAVDTDPKVRLHGKAALKKIAPS